MINSRVDVASRLREIEAEKRGVPNFNRSRISEAGGTVLDRRSSSKDRNPMIGLGLQTKRVATESVNTKLDSML